MITITKKESSLVWMLRKAKTARLVITLYRHITDKLPTSYRHITNCRPTVGRLSADCRPTDSLCFGENLSADSRPTVGQQTADSRPTDGRQSADRFFGELFFTITRKTVKCSPIYMNINIACLHHNPCGFKSPEIKRHA